MKPKRVLLAGATGYLGRYIASLLLDNGYCGRLIVRNKQKACFDERMFEVVEAEITKPQTLASICNSVDIVISTVGITRQKDGLTYMDVDYQANVNLLEEAKRNGVKKFIYVSVFNGEMLRNLKICEAKEKFTDCLKVSGLDYCIIRPNGFFSDMGDFLKMAEKGTIYLFGDGTLKLNPIHGEDLARVCLDAIEGTQKEINVGGTFISLNVPDILSFPPIAAMPSSF